MPLSGAAVARVYLIKRDTYTGVHFDASYIQSQVGISSLFQLLLLITKLHAWFSLHPQNLACKIRVSSVVTGLTDDGIA